MKKSKQTAIRLSDYDLSLISKLKKSLGLTMTEILRRGIELMADKYKKD